MKTQKEIKAAVNKITKDIKDFIDVKIISQRKQVKVKVSPGRPSLTSEYKNKWEFTYSIQWTLNDKAIAETSKTDGIFPLTTNTKLKASEVLRKYKTQPFLEKRMYTKKTVLEVAPVFLKKETRIEAMLFLYFVALMIVSLIERKIRMNMATEKIEKLPVLPQGMNSKKPTWNNIRYFYDNVHYSQIIRDGVSMQAVVKGLSDLHERANQRPVKNSRFSLQKHPGDLVAVQRYMIDISALYAKLQKYFLITRNVMHIPLDPGHPLRSIPVHPLRLIPATYYGHSGPP